MTTQTPDRLSSPPFKVGVLVIPPTQLLDISSVDLFGMLSPSYLAACKLPAPLIALGVHTEIQYIASSHQVKSGANAVELTADAHLVSTSGLSSPQVQPGMLDVLLIPGPDPSLIPSDAEKQFIRAHYETGTTDILSVCTGIFMAGYAGILTGHEVTGPRALIPELKSKFPGGNWVEKRWVRSRIPPQASSSLGTSRSASLWISGGITNGLDMVSAYIHAHPRFGTELADLVCRMADVEDRGQEYATGKVQETGWWVWLILRSWWIGGRSKKIERDGKQLNGKKIK
jgi:transcriptional regulator GlxA family with amidase domain